MKKYDVNRQKRSIFAACWLITIEQEESQPIIRTEQIIFS